VCVCVTVQINTPNQYSVVYYAIQLERRDIVYEAIFKLSVMKKKWRI